MNAVYPHTFTDSCIIFMNFIFFMNFMVKYISLYLANSRVSPATAGCLCARNGFTGSAQGLSKMSKMAKWKF